MTATYNNEYTSTQQKALTMVGQCGMLLADQSNKYKRKETYENGGVKEHFSLKWRMDSAYAQKKSRNSVCVCSQEEEEDKESGRGLLRTSFEGREDDRTPGAREASQHLQIKKASVWRQWTVGNLVAVSHFFSRVWQQNEKRPRDSLISVTSIHDRTKSCQWLHKTEGSERKNNEQ